MSANERGAADAVYALTAVARLLRASPYAAEDPSWAELHATYFEDIAGAVQRDAALRAEDVENGAKYVGLEWESALIPILYGEDNAESVVRTVQAHQMARKGSARD